MLKLNGVTTYGKSDQIKFNPLELVTRFAAYTGRKQRTPEQIDKMAASLLLNGQEQAFTYRKGFDGGPIPITGHTRILGAAKITNERMVGPTGIQYGPKNPFLVRGDFRQMNDVEALFHTFAENDGDSRTPLNDVDIAIFIRTVSETTGITDAEIATKLGKPASWISNHRKVLDLDAATQQAIIDGTVKFDVAVNTVAAIEPSQRAAVIEKVKKANGGKVTAAGVAKVVREEGVPTNKKLVHTDAELKTWMRETIKTAPESLAKDLLFAILDFRSGAINEDGLVAAYDALQAALPVTVTIAAASASV